MPLINFSGIASGIDSEALIRATIEAQRSIRITPAEEKIARLEDTNSSLTELKSKIKAVQDLLYGITSANGGAVFKSATSSSDSVLTATASQSAYKGTYTVTVSQLARNDVRTSNDSFASSDTIINPALPGSSTVTVTIGTGGDMETVNVNLDNTTTLAEFAADFNENATKAIANVVKIADNDYRIVFTSNNTGTSLGQIAFTDPDLNFPTGFTASQAQNATFDIDGIATGITRPTNTISDVIPGVTMTLVDAGTSTMTIGIDSNKTKSKIQEFVSKYNEVVALINEGNTIEREEEGENVQNIFGPLTGTRVDENAWTTMRTVISGVQFNPESGSIVYTNLSSIGLQTQRDGTLTFVTSGSQSGSDFDTAIAAEPTSVENLLTDLADAMAATGNDVDSYTQFNGLIDTTKTSNDDLIRNLNDQIARAESALARQEATMRAQFARLEALIGRMQSQQASLLSALGALGTGQ